MSATTLDVSTSYMSRAHNPRDVIDTFRLLRKHHSNRLQFDTLVGTGLSGAIIVPPLARALRKNYLIVRKSDDGSHSEYPAEGVLGKRWVFVDDLIASGATLRRVIDVVQGLPSQVHKSDFSTELVAAFLYNDGYEQNSAILCELDVFRGKGFLGDDRWEWTRTISTHETKVRRDLCTGCEGVRV